jgi:hypothetical protein
MSSRYRQTQDQINYLDTIPATDPAVLAWALAKIVDQRVWEVRVARFGVTLFPRELPPVRYGEAQADE